MEPLNYKEVRQLDRWKFDEYLKVLLEPYGRTWEIIKDAGFDGFHNGEHLSATVVSGQEIEEDTTQNFQRWLEGGQYNDEPEETDSEEDKKFYEKYYRNATPGFSEMLQWICNQGLVPEGKYVMEVWW